MDLSLQRLDRRYLVPADACDAVPRLDAGVSATLEGALSAAAEALGLAQSVEVCIRSLHVPVDVALDASEGEVAAELTRAFTRSLADAVRGAGAPEGVVVFPSRTHAVADVAVRAPAGDSSRAWAWAQLGLWPAQAVVGERAALEATARCLVAHAAEVPAVLRLIPAPAAASLVARLGPPILREVVRAVLVAHGQPPSLADQLVSAAPPGVPAEAVEPARSTSGRLERAVRHLPWVRLLIRQLASALRSAATAQTAREVVALASVLAVAGTAPEVLVLARELPAALPIALETLRAEEKPEEPLASRAAPGAASAEPAPVRAAAAARAREVSPARAEVTRTRELTPEEAPAPEAMAPEALDAGAWTEWGGLLFLFHTLAALDVAARHANEAALGARSLRWVLHLLAQRLAPVAPGDAAALALAGLGPDEEPPTEVEPAASDEERAAVEALRVEVLARLRADFALRRIAAPRDDAQLVGRVCRRRARISLAGRWLEAALSLDEVDTDVRRLGLDLDPGWLRWLGVVVRFRYA